MIEVIKLIGLAVVWSVSITAFVFGWLYFWTNKVPMWIDNYFGKKEKLKQDFLRKLES